jgi:Flp pilus assembly protein TadG
MKNSVIAFSVASVLLISLIIVGTVKTGIVAALTAATTDATTTASDTASASTSSTSADSTTSATDASSTSPTPPAQTQTPDQSQAQSPSSGKSTLKLVHVVGTKYVDYFTDGTKTYSFPGNPDIDSNLNKPNAPIPTHGNLTWVSTSGMDAYDTPSGDLEIGDYAQESDGSYISNVPAYTYTDATSSVPIPTRIATSKTDPTAATQ